MRSRLDWLLRTGDCAGGALTAILTALAVRAVVPPHFDMVAAMMIGMALGTAVHLAVGILLAPLLGMFESMIPGMFIGMYGGMLFGMRDSMQRVTLTTDLAVAAAFGVIVTLGVEFWNVQLQKQPVANNARCGSGAGVEAEEE